MFSQKVFVLQRGIYVYGQKLSTVSDASGMSPSGKSQ